MKADLHIHTHYSPDAFVPLNNDLVSILKRRDITAIAIADHNTFEGVVKAKKLLEKKGILVVPGEEIKTTEYGELLCLFLNEEIKPSGYLEVIDNVKEQGGLVGLSHPFDFSRKNWIRKMQIDWVKKYVDIIEVYNARCNLNSMNKRAYSFCAKYNIPFTAGSDAHFTVEIGRGGLLLEYAETVEDIRRQIMSNKTSVLPVGNSLPFVNVSSILFHALTGLSRFFWPIGQYLSS